MIPRALRDDLRGFIADKRRTEHAPAHYHGCPECYEHEPCTLNCAIEPELGTHKGAPIGDYVACSRCEKAST